MDEDTPRTRIEAIDFLRGVAVLGILAINVTGFWGPSLATFSPRIPEFATGSDPWFALAFVVFEGKMRALFSLLFGASMVLFAQSAERHGADPDLAQLRRLAWLLLFGYLHFVLLWWGDILFLYALCGLGALALRRLEPIQLLGIALPFYLLAQGIEALFALPGVFTEQAVLGGTAAPSDVAEQAAMMGRIAASVARDVAVLNAGFLEAIRLKLSSAPLQPLNTTLSTFTETLPLMLIGMAMMRSGFFTDWPRRRLASIAGIGILGGGLPTVLVTLWLWHHGWPPRAMFAAIEHGMALPHLMMALGYAAALLVVFPSIRKWTLARALVAAGKCAFSNYIGTTVLMGAIFSGWGLGLGPELPRVWLPAFVLLGWGAMLSWPQWWLARFGQGPLERLWRRLALPRGDLARQH
ncbi:DUF418 domain-containing protein [Novosphingobium taihuense]|uniref:DUF418 domain-containing protein n=1 Tax=Novosphingobium taihuense TaxID=260085 RepID=A0A7W7ESJ6_9SPHN|nr:DUF418 domain-containing protein [Novosphingobium taihuense]MBB4611866.1 uncharacterized protein [Novosphingobium taihuense]TWH88779.1 uncharacterized protein IQ25_00905 [Novosphingobium taihuense]